MALRLFSLRFAAIACCVALLPATASAVAWNRMATIDNATATNNSLCNWSTTGSGLLTCSSANPYIVGGFLGIGSSAPVNALDIGTSQGIRIASGTPTNTAFALYNNAGTLTWNGAALASLSGGVSNYDAIWTSPTTIGTGLIYESGGKVGIGTTSPFTALDVGGVIAADGGNSISGTPPTVGNNTGWKIGLFGSIQAFGTANNTLATKYGSWFSFFSGNSPANNATTTVPDSNALISFGSTGNALFAGNVGIGTTTPANRLDVNGSLAVGSFAGTATGGINQLIVSGNVGIGTTTPSRALQVSGGDIMLDSGRIIRWMNSSGTQTNLLQLDASNNFLVGAGTGFIGNLYLQTAGNTDITVLGSNGNVGIGITSPGSKLQVNGGAAIGYSANTAAPTNGLAVSGTVGVGTTSPATGVTADIAGPVKVAGTGSEPCTPAQVGSIRYNAAGQYFEVCNYP